MKIKFKINGYEYNGIIEESKEHLSIFGGMVKKHLVKRFLTNGDYDYQLINDFQIMGQEA